jgi:beta-N-acetylhexosaminidase
MRKFATLLVALLVSGCMAPAGLASIEDATVTPAPPSATPVSVGSASVSAGPVATSTLPGTTRTPSPTGTASATSIPSSAGAATSATPSLAQLVGQKLMVRMVGTTPSASLLARVKAGQVGGVILFGDNISSASQVRALTSKLRAAAAAGGQPPLLISTDQEGGSVKRIPWIAPTLSPPQMGAIGLTSTARQQGLATGQGLFGLGIDCDLAPVADVPKSKASFMYLDGRTWSFDSAVTASLSNAFAHGLLLGGVVPVMKHFPGIGRATQNTDVAVVTLTGSQTDLAPGIQPYVTAIARGYPMIMLSNATYTAYDPANGAGWSRAIVRGLLHDQLGFRGVTITDSLSGTAKARGIPVSELAIRAAIAGTDMILVTGSEASTQATYQALLAAAESGRIPLTRLQAQYDRILALKATL